MKNSAYRARAFQPLALALVCCFLLPCAPAAAQAPVTAFTFRGTLEEAGAPAEGVYDLRFALYDKPADGSLLGTLVREDVSVERGVYAVTLDFGADAFTSGGARYVEIGVRPGASKEEFETRARRARS